VVVDESSLVTVVIDPVVDGSVGPVTSVLDIVIELDVEVIDGSVLLVLVSSFVALTLSASGPSPKQPPRTTVKRTTRRMCMPPW
jgi:hypothetical protein